MGYLCSDIHIKRNFFSINKHVSNYGTIAEWFFLHSTQCLAYEIKKCQRKYSNAAK